MLGDVLHECAECSLYLCRYSAVNANTGVLSELLAAGTTGAPCMCHVTPTELMLAQDNLSLFAGGCRAQAVTFVLLFYILCHMHKRSAAFKWCCSPNSR